MGGLPAPLAALWRHCTFTRLTCLVFLAYASLLARTVWTLFRPVTHTGPGVGHRPAWAAAETVDLYVHASESPQAWGPVVHEARGLDRRNTYVWRIEVQLPKKVRQAGPWYAHVVVAQHGRTPLPGPGFAPTAVLQATQALTARSACRRNDTRTLLSALVDEEEPANATCSFLKPKLLVRIIEDATEYPVGGIPADVYPYLEFTGKRRYKPVLYLDETWLLKEHLLPLNASAANLTLEVRYAPMPLGGWRLLRRFDEALRTLQGLLGPDSEEPDNMRRMITETSPLLLAVTFGVTIIHLLFDVLAFKNDIAFWRSRKSMEGLSANNVVAELGCQVVLTLYLFHNEAGWPILLPMAVGLVIQVWKAGIAVRLKAQGKDSSTAQADAQAMRWLSYVLYPLVVGYAGYSLLYKEHKGWYGWGLESLASAVYAFGFALMTPQLYINYKLKSVANLPWRVFLYRACNTFIDDLFAFIIKMPTLHRLSAFRDDLIFVIYLFQRWQYPVDPTRHEGFEGEEVKGSHEVQTGVALARQSQRRSSWQSAQPLRVLPHFPSLRWH